MDHPSNNADPLMSVEQTADYLGMSSNFVRKQIAEGSMESTRLGRLVRVRLSAVERFIEAKTNAGA